MSGENSTTIVPAAHKPEAVNNLVPPPPIWLGRTAYLFRLGFAIVVLISSLLGLVSCGVSAKEISWLPASEYFSRGLIEQIITENSSLTPDNEIINRMQVYQLAEKPRLTFVDFNTDEMCGQMGCLYVIYLESEGKTKKVLSRYLRPELPEDVPLISLSSHTQNDLPCIVFNQLAETNLQQVTLCYNGDEYQNSSYTILKRDFQQ